MNLCITKQANGTACTIAAQCTSGFCSDGYCCSAACSGGCDVCSAALGATANGTCTNLPVGNAGEGSSCSPYLCAGGSACPTSCTVDTQCTSGYACVAGSCTPKLANGTACAAANQCTSGFCVDSYCCNAACNAGGCQRCDLNGALGVCTQLPQGNGGNPSCGAYVCNGASGACPTSCTSDTGCAGTDWCSAGACVAKAALGTACSGANQCATGYCVDGVCCNAACNGGCDACNLGGSVGTCRAVAAGNPGANPACSPYLCDGLNGACPATCSSDASCAGGYWCNAGACTAKGSNGTACTATDQCVSGNCADGYCCTAACAGGCDVCSAALGASANGNCTVLAAGSTGANPSCGGYLCGGAASCPTSCTVDANCSAGYGCVGGICQGRQAQGTTCTANNACLSGFCADGYCCNAACTGSCDVCSAALGATANGSCTVAARGTAGNPSCIGFLCDGTSPGCPTVCATDMDCVGGYTCVSNTCVPKQALGTPCSAGTQCQSGFCTDGVCCSAACGGACDVCSVALGASVNGTCTPLAAGSAGTPSCAPFVCNGSSGACPAACVTDAGCDAAHYCSGGACVARAITGTACTAADQCATNYCVDGFCCNAACNAGGCQRCDVAGQQGSCVVLAQGSAGNPSCGAYVCDGANGACPATCTADSACASGYWCGAGTCHPKGGPGAACSATNQCTSGFCADGVCCNTACNGGCDACNLAGSSGTCTVVAAGSPGAGPNCAPYVCDGTNAACPASCTTNASCASGAYCQAGVCIGRLGDGQACAIGTDCLSGFCTDGVCCNAACSGPCDVCSAALGATSSGTCTDVAGPGNPSCGAYQCTGASAACPTSCVDDTSCSGGNFCSGGRCVPKLAGGGACTAASQCQSGFCADSVCCNTACAGSCDRCDLGGSVGTCTVTPVGQLGAPSCAPFLCDGVNPACPSLCAQDANCAPGAYCNGGTCTFKAVNGTPCGVAGECRTGFCVDGVCCDSACTGSCARCDNANYVGTCRVAATGFPGANPSCAPFTCDGVSTTCPMFCTSDASCIAGFACVAGKCVAKVTNGTACTASNQCTSGFCADGYCCNAACGGGCDRCDLPGQQGSCTPLPAGSTGMGCGSFTCDGASGTCPTACTSDGGCATGSWCDSSGRCQPKASLASACTAADQCLSGFCADGMCCNAACGGACDRCDLPGAQGTCSPTPAGMAGTPSCGAYVCDGTNATCPTVCAADASCANGFYCATGACAPKQVAGQTCTTNSACVSGFCVDDGAGGVCCSTACAGACDRCDTPGSQGTCVIDAQGAAGKPSCAPYVCSGSSAACPTSCTSDADCEAGSYCNNGTCASKGGPGAACSDGHTCASGHCADGVCCNSDCTGQCAACNLPSSTGTCTAVVGTPVGGRSACAGIGTCAGTCDGTHLDACTFPDTSTVCAPASCHNGVAMLAATCDGKGACSPAQGMGCGRAGCNGDVCGVLPDGGAAPADMASPPAQASGCSVGAGRGSERPEAAGALASLLLVGALVLRRRGRAGR
jgi:hypothetical protein